MSFNIYPLLRYFIILFFQFIKNIYPAFVCNYFPQLFFIIQYIFFYKYDPCLPITFFDINFLVSFFQ